MRNDFEDILTRYGHDVYLQRADLDDCGERVYSDTLEKHTTRFSIGIHRNLPRSQAEQMEGILNTTDRSYYFKYDVNPFEGDRIYDYLDRNEDDKEVWLINSAVGLRGTDGRIIYWVAGVTRIWPN